MKEDQVASCCLLAFSPSVRPNLRLDKTKHSPLSIEPLFLGKTHCLVSSSHCISSVSGDNIERCRDLLKLQPPECCKSTNNRQAANNLAEKGLAELRHTVNFTTQVGSVYMPASLESSMLLLNATGLLMLTPLLEVFDIEFFSWGHGRVPLLQAGGQAVGVFFNIDAPGL